MDKNRCIVVDDEPAAHYVLVNYIERSADLELVAQCYNAFEALEYLRNNRVDLIFLDIDMPEITGMEFLKMLDNPPKIILTTAYSEYALESYDYGVVDYLLKPISFPRFFKALQRFLSYNNSVIPSEDEPKTISIRMDGRLIDIKLSQIDFIQSFGNYVKIVTPAQTYLTAITTQQILKQLPASKFVRIHKSYIASINKVSKYEHGLVQINNMNLPVGITFRRELQEKLENT
ncbi:MULTISPECIES: LytR/AlgR family response regulator transcription factor [Sphingobacterium]|uniref:LytR/AlgR family response regulator transcription factor n=1 Tax=Sphingobacterium TaxID=28453 RepID=UPI001046C13E|nr:MULTISPECIES: LytTR family DNA-binding domain-containing protein [Sphingobacterium]MCW2259889.1 DNA-binding LytR/AlgR family response regulator [Sphingobacterium kitahiroshimense]NJI72160.1 response regulator transcription factor [Sphingobacterium sp. B16(2022)]TCR11315.1 LytTR family two component transcriptional regulator [Sphingobacterium sp. JUb78]